MTNYVACPICGRQTTARKARSHQQMCKRVRAQAARDGWTYIDLTRSPPELAPMDLGKPGTVREKE